jgi:PEP-CTERM motif-containing protein
MKRGGVITMGLAIVGLLGLASTSALAVTNLTIQQEPAGTVGPQSTSNPCIIAATQCQQPAGFTFNNFVSSGAISSYDESQSYTVQNLRDFVGNTFVVAIDVNTTDAAGEVLNIFTLTDTTTSTLLYQCTTACSGTNIGALSSNGNGFADWTLRSFDISGLAATDTLTFRAAWNNATDGGESFFIIPGQPVSSTPEPTSLLLVGAGLAGIGIWRRKLV